MISKKVLSEIVSKYSLGGHVEKVKWVVNKDDEIARRIQRSRAVHSVPHDLRPAFER